MKRRTLRILISAGPTREPIDPVRFISNYSTGMMGAALAKEALHRGHRVTMVNGPVSAPMPKAARVIHVERARQMRQALRSQAAAADAVIMAAAVADYEPVKAVSRKLSRVGGLTLKLKATPDIIGTLARRRGQVFVGFALETDAVLARAARKLKHKKLDVLLAQQALPGTANRAGQAGLARPPFGNNKVRAWLLQPGGCVRALGRVSKAQVARALLDKIEALWYGQQSRKAQS